MEWHPSGNLTLRLRVREEWRVLPRTPTTSHPLNPITVKDLPSCESIGPDSHHRRTSVSGWTGTRKKSTATTTAAVPWFGLDPLSAALLSQQQQDHDYQDYPHQSQPHRRHRAASAGEDVGGGGQVRRGSTVVTKTTVHKKDDDEWNTFRSQVLSRYTTQEKLTIKSSFLSPGSESSLSASSAGAGGAGGETPVATVSMTDQVRNRLQQLDDVDDGLREERGLTAKEFADRIDSLKKSLLQSWSSDQRVRALKIVIQSAKLLSDVSVVRFYPSVFALVTGEILDHFSSLVHNRIEERWRGAGSKELAVETCRNWIYKISRSALFLTLFLSLFRKLCSFLTILVVLSAGLAAASGRSFPASMWKRPSCGPTPSCTTTSRRGGSRCWPP